MSKAGSADGIAFAPILACIAVLSSAAARRIGRSVLGHVHAETVSFRTPLLSALVGWLGGRLVDQASKAEVDELNISTIGRMVSGVF